MALAALFMVLFTVSGCRLGETKDLGTGPFSVRVTWTANIESAVNSAGGGYRVYYGTKPNLDITKAPYVDVPYESGPTAPTYATIGGLTLRAPARYYFKVVAYSAVPRPDAVLAMSDGSEISIAVPEK